MIPRDGPVPLDDVAAMISSAPAELGIEDMAEVRSVVVLHSDGRRLNHYTVLRLAPPPPAYAVQEILAGPAKLLSWKYAPTKLVDRPKLLDALTSWCGGNLVGAFQQSANTTHHESSSMWCELPCWIFDAYDNSPNSRDFNAPRGPFKSRESNFFAEDLGAVVRIWAYDPSSHDNTVRNAYRVILPDPRGYIRQRSLEGNKLVLSVSGTKVNTLTCALTTSKDGQRELRDVVRGRVEFVLSQPKASWEVYVFDESDAWCDHYFYPGVTSASTSVSRLFAGSEGVEEGLVIEEERVEQPLLEKVESLQDILVKSATGEPPDEKAYQRLRRELMADTSVTRLLPSVVRKARTLKQFWAFIRKVDTYNQRREYLWGEFRPLLEKLEGVSQSPADQSVAEVLKGFDREAVHDVWQRALERRVSDPAGAVTTARTLLETVCKHILELSNVRFDDDEELPRLYRLTAMALKVAPSQHTEKVFKQILGGATSVVEGLGALRNRLGDAHGRGKQPPKPAARHAELAVNLAGAVATFLVETWQAAHDSG